MRFVFILVLTDIFFNATETMQTPNNNSTNQSPKKALPYIGQFKRGIFWTLIDSLGSQSLVILYHLIFRAGAGQTMHGIMGCLLSLLYLATAVTNLGLNKIIAPFLETFIRSRKHLRLFISTLVIPQLMFLLVLSIITVKSLSYIQQSIPFIASLTHHLSNQLIPILALTFVSESMRKTLRVFLQLSFYFRLTALVELLGMGANLAGIFFFYKQGNLSLLTSWHILAYTSFAQLIALTIGILVVHQSLPKYTSGDQISVPDLLKRVTKNRLFSWALQCLNQLHSGNFLVPICALRFGIESASLMKVITSISYWITLIAKKVFGVSSNALLAHLKSRSADTQKQAFHYLSRVFNQALYGLLIFLVINGKKLALEQLQGHQTVTWSLLYFMLLLTFCESFFILYEKWYILEEDAHIYLAFNGISIATLYALIRSLHSPTTIIITVIILRIITFILLSLFSFYRWNIWPSFKPHLTTLIGAITLATLFNLLL